MRVAFSLQSPQCYKFLEVRVDRNGSRRRAVRQSPAPQGHRPRSRRDRPVDAPGPRVPAATIGGEDNRWHSSLATPHPHGVQVKLPKPAKIGRVTIHFADPCGYPVDIRGSVIPDGQQQFQEIFRVTGNSDPYVWRGTIAPLVTDTFRLVIEKSVNPVSLNAAQISEIELCPPAADQPTAR